MNTKIGKIKDIVEEMKPPGRNNWIVVKHDPAGIPISGNQDKIQPKINNQISSSL